MIEAPTNFTECRLVGTVKEADLEGLFDVLINLAGEKGREFRSYEIIHRSDGPPSIDVRLQRSLPNPATAADDTSGPWWTVRNETELRRGPVRNLPVTVVTVTMAESYGREVPRVWEAMGTFFSRENIREGTCFHIEAAGETVVVIVSRLFRVLERENLEATEEVSPGHQLVEMKCRVSRGEHCAGSQALTDIRDHLCHHVNLMKG